MMIGLSIHQDLDTLSILDGQWHRQESQAVAEGHLTTPGKEATATENNEGEDAGLF